MAKILFFDTEANSLDTKFGFVQELAWALYDSESKRCLDSNCRLIKWNRGYTVDPEAFNVTGLSREFCEDHGSEAGQVFEEFLDPILNKKVDYLCGHNILGFDVPIMTSNILRSSYPNVEVLNSVPFIDTYIDLPYPDSIRNYSLKYLALDHGYALLGAHQAMNDVFACAHVFFKYPFDKILELAISPLVTFAAYTAYQNVAARDQLKSLKFRWNGEKKRWEKSARKSHLGIIRARYDGPLFINDVLFEPEQEKAEKQMELPF